MEGGIYQSCVRLETLQQSLTCCLQENKIAILKKTERALYGAKLIKKKEWSRTYEIAEFGSNFEQTSQSEWNAMVCACFRKDNDDVLRMVFNFEKVGRRRG